MGGTGWTKTASIAVPDLAVDSTGRTVFASSLHTQVDFGSGPILPNDTGSTAFLMLLDASGKPLWNKRWGKGSGQSWARQAAFDPSGNVLAAGYFGDVTDLGGGPVGAPFDANTFLVKLTPSGGYLWSHILNSATHIRDLTVDSAGNVFVSGASPVPVDFGAGPLPHSVGGADAFVVKLDPSGNQLWGKDFGKDGVTGIVDARVAVSAAGEVFFFGDNPKLDYGGGLVVESQVVLKLQSNGSFVWSKGLSTSTIYTSDIAADGAGGAIVAGSFQSSFNVGLGSHNATGAFAARINQAGAPVWDKVLTGPNYIVKVLVDAGGTIRLSGSYAGSVDFGPGAYMSSGPNDTDGFIARLSLAGTATGVTSISGIGLQSFSSFGLTPGGKLIVSGSYSGTLDFSNGGGPITTPNQFESFLAQITP